MRKLILTALAAIGICSCSSIDCPVQNSVYTNYAFYKADGSKDTLKDTMSIFTTMSNGRDTLVFNRGVGVHEFSLPISYVNPADTYYIGRKPEGASSWKADYFIVNKINTPRFESVDCQVAYFHTITSIDCGGIFIDSISINNAKVDYDTERLHFKVYLKKQD